MLHIDPAIPWLSEESPCFPSADIALSEPNGLLAAGGNLKPETLINAYQNGIFPWFNEGEPPLWWSPDPRLILDPTELSVSRSLARTIRAKPWTVSLNHEFASVIAACMQSRTARPDTWITSAMYQAYLHLHHLGFAHCVEVFDEHHTLIGGLYGVSIGCMFFGESMFSFQRDVSKVALFYLCQYLTQHHLPLIDCQVQNEHLIRLGAKPMPRTEFIQKITELCAAKPDTKLWNKQILSVS